MKSRPYILPSRTDDWATPQQLFDALDAEFRFTLDAAASRHNAKCRRYFTRRRDGLSQSWGRQVVWCNPPYGRVIAHWVRKAHEASLRGATVVMLLPSRTDTKWFHQFAWKHGEVRFLEGRVKFGGAKTAAPFPSVVVVFRPAQKRKRAA